MSTRLDTDTISPQAVKGTYHCMKSNICLALQGYELYNQNWSWKNYMRESWTVFIFGVWE